LISFLGYSNEPCGIFHDSCRILDAVKELEEIKTDIVNTDNIKNIVFKLPREIAFIELPKDTSILKASIQQISALNQMFNLQSIGGFEN